ncbi:MAG: M3 family metallopeptidase [Ignavibacteriales bacterium]|nr:M3 family metallopeptidase [Ignavibacteriales bacterium]
MFRSAISSTRRNCSARKSSPGGTSLPRWARPTKPIHGTKRATSSSDNFNKFSPELGAFAQRAFDNNWIDAEQREGKRGGAFCMGVPGVKESRILSNFDGSFDQVSTLAHELGHAFHNECAYQAGKTAIQQDTPMTLAETASIMCETIVTEAVLEQVTDPQEILAVLEAQMNGAVAGDRGHLLALPVREGSLRAPRQVPNSPPTT